LSTELLSASSCLTHTPSLSLVTISETLLSLSALSSYDSGRSIVADWTCPNLDVCYTDGEMLSISTHAGKVDPPHGTLRVYLLFAGADDIQRGLSLPQIRH